MPENPTLQNADWNADGQPQADQDLGGHHGDQGDENTQREDGQGPKEGRDRPPAGTDHKRSPWLGGG